MQLDYVFYEHNEDMFTITVSGKSQKYTKEQNQSNVCRQWILSANSNMLVSFLPEHSTTKSSTT